MITSALHIIILCITTFIYNAGAVFSFGLIYVGEGVYFLGGGGGGVGVSAYYWRGIYLHGKENVAF